MILQKNNFVIYTLFIANSIISLREKFPSLLVNKLIVFSSKYTKPVKNSCNGRMLRKKPSPFETTLNKNPPLPSNESSSFSSKIDLRSFYHPKYHPTKFGDHTHCGRGHKFLVCDVTWTHNQRVMWLGR